MLAPLTLFPGTPARAETETLTIRGDGVEKELVYTRDELEKLDAQNHIISTINNFPTERVDYVSGVLLEELLEAAGLKETARLITFTATDGYSNMFTIKELLGTPRYYFPADGEKTPVPAMICLQSGSESFEKLEPDDLRLIMGQRADTEQNNPWFVKKISIIEVSCEEPEKWPEVTFNRTVEPEGVMLTLSHESFDSVKIYYTTDGSDPTVESSMYNISATRFQPHLNAPLLISETTIVRAIAIGCGREDSAVSSIAIVLDEPIFSDLAGFDWAKAAIEDLAVKGIVNGVGDFKFNPSGNLTRGMFVTMLHRAAGLPGYSEAENPFRDVPEGQWYTKAVYWAVENEIIQGYEDGTFKPLREVTLQEMMVMAVRAGFPDAEQTEEEFVTPIIGVSDWALRYALIAEKNGLLLRGHIAEETKDGIVVDGKRQATRAEAAVIVYSLLES